jgi:hypothetical protein
MEVGKNHRTRIILTFLITLKILFEKYDFSDIFNNVESHNLIYQSDLKNEILYHRQHYIA